MSQHVSVVAKRAFQQNHFLLVAAGETRTVGLHQVKPLVDNSLSIRTLGVGDLPDTARVEDLAGRGYTSIPRLFDVTAHGLVDIQKERSVMHGFAGLTGSVSTIGLMKFAEELVKVATDSALSMMMSDGAVYVSNAEVGAQIFVELDTKDSGRGPLQALTNGMYTCRGSGPVHLIGGVEAMIVSRSSVEFRGGIQEDATESRLEGSGMSADDIAALRLRITQEDNDALFLEKDCAVDSLPIPNHGVMMRALSGAVGVWESDKLIHVLDAGSGVTLLCHPGAQMVQLMATTETARILKVPFKLS